MGWGYGIICKEKANPECQAVALVIFLWKTKLEIVISMPNSSCGWMPQADSYLRPLHGWESPRWARSRSCHPPDPNIAFPSCSGLVLSWILSCYPRDCFPVSVGLIPFGSGNEKPRIQLLPPPRDAPFWLCCSPCPDWFAVFPGAAGSILCPLKGSTAGFDAKGIPVPFQGGWSRPFPARAASPTWPWICW